MEEILLEETSEVGKQEVMVEAKEIEAEVTIEEMNNRETGGMNPLEQVEVVKEGKTETGIETIMTRTTRSTKEVTEITMTIMTETEIAETEETEIENAPDIEGMMKKEILTEIMTEVMTEVRRVIEVNTMIEIETVVEAQLTDIAAAGGILEMVARRLRAIGNLP